MFFKYRKKYRLLLGQSKVNEEKLRIKLYDALMDHNKCKQEFQSLFLEYKEKKYIINTIKKIRNNKKFNGEQGAEIDKLIN